jgi:glucose-1-phosphate adenylyltransferase
MSNISKSMIAVVMGGGAGKRLAPLTENRSKPAVPIAGKYRLVDIPISNCMNSDVTRIFVLTQFNSASLNKHIKNTYHFSIFSKAFVDILAAEQRPGSELWFQGTADAVRQSLHHILSFEFEYVLILSGDQLYQMDFCEMLDAHKKANADISIATIPVAARDATDYGILKSDKDGMITSFIEKPKAELLPQWSSEVSAEMQAAGRKYLASMGIYIFNRDLLIRLLREKENATDFGKEIIPQSIGSHRVLSYQFEGYWTDIGNIRSFFEANIALTDDVPQFNLFDNSRAIFTHARMLPPSKISGTILDRTMIAEGCIITASRIERSVIGIRTRIGFGTTISNTYVMGVDSFEPLEEILKNKAKGNPPLGIGDRCHITNTIIDRNCRIGNDVIINGGSHLPDTDNELYTIKEGIVVIKKSAIVPDNMIIG